MMKTYIMIVLLILFFLSSCGYHFEGGGFLNVDIQQVAVRLFEDNSSETGSGIKFTNALTSEITARTDTKVVNENMADVVIAGRINKIVFSVVSRSSTESVSQRRVRAVVDVKMSDAKGEILWSVKNLSSDETYSVSGDSASDEEGKSQAIDKVANRVAERLVSGMLADF